MTDSRQQVPVIDLAGAHAGKVQQVAIACGDWGFFQVANHGLDSALSKALHAASQEFFAQPLAQKRSAARSVDNPFGYYDRELTKNLRDRKEIFDFAPGGTTPWPPAPDGFRPALERYASACHQLALHLLELCCEGLGAEPRSLSGRFQPGHSSFLRLNYYPHSDPLAGTGAPATGPFGISHHTDAGALTVLLQDEVAGLQVYRNHQWFDVTPVAETLTINIGDMLQVWSNDRYQAPLHRVLASRARDRFSTAYFFNPAYNAVVAPLGPVVSGADPAHYRPIIWGEFRGLRALGDYGDYGEEVQVAHYRV
jgi:isopenicillin N synthase-like dioxygenase